MELRSDINRDLVPKLHQAFERYLPQVQLADGYKLGFARKYKLSPSILEGFLNWVLPAREGQTILDASNTHPRDVEAIFSHSGEIVVVGEPIEEEKGDKILDLQEKLSSNAGFKFWLETPANGRTKTLLIPFADVKRGHWVLFTLQNQGEENHLQFVDTKSKVTYFQSIAKRAKRAFFAAVDERIENAKVLPSLYLGSQDMLDRTSCGFQVTAMILQIADHSEKAFHKANKPLVISTIPSSSEPDSSYWDAMRDPYSNFIKGFTPDVGKFDLDLNDSEATSSTDTFSEAWDF